MTDEAVQRDLGKMEAQIATLVAQVAAQNVKIDQIQTTLAQATGGYKMLLLVGGAGGAVGAFIAKILPFLNMRGP